VELRVAIDGIAVSHPQPGGYKTYSTNLVRHLAVTQSDADYVLFVDRPLPFGLPPNWRVERISSGHGGVGVAWREQVGLPRRARQRGVSVLHSPCATGPLWAGLPVVVTIHDTIEFTESLQPVGGARWWAMRLYSRWVQAHLATRADAIITVSDYSKRQIMARFQLPSDRISVIHEAPSSIYRPVDRSAAAAVALEQWGVCEYVLALASRSLRKNTVPLMQAYALLPARLRERHPLLLVCAHRSLAGALAARGEELGLAPHLRVAEGVTDEQLLYLYNAAALFVFPSAQEGFGLPPLEAMSCGTPVLASNRSSLPDVLGDAALLVDPADLSGLATAMESILITPALRAELAVRGLVHSRRFSWARAAEETLAVYRQVALEQTSPRWQ
jgi:glycosyltransferase involved in cell wall biosynthesis